MPFDFPDRPLGTLSELWTAIRGLLPQLEPVFLTNVAIGTIETPVAHFQRGIPPYFTVTPQGDARVWRTRASDKRCLYLQASAAVTVDIEVRR